MAKSEPTVRWAPRVHPSKLRRLYELDAQGILDDDLINEVGYTLYSRSQSIFHVCDAMNGKVHCPQCDTIILRHTDDPTQVVQCPNCGWEARWGDYSNAYRTQELGAIGAADILHDFMSQWEHVRTARDKMLLIDQLIHRWHWETARQRPKFGLGRPTGLNLIEGNKQQVLALLDTLSYGESSTMSAQTKAAWRTHWQEIQERQAASHAMQRAKRAARKRRDEAEQG
jgi:ribosomal protein L37AE/L43A